MDFKTEDDSLLWDVLTSLVLSLNMRLQWKEIRDVTHKRYERYDKETFGVILNRVLKRLLHSGDIKRESLGHQKVYYFIPKQRKQKITDELVRRFMHKKMDEIWGKLSSNQRKKAVENLTLQHGMLIQAEKHLAETMVSGIKELAEVYSSNLEKPSENINKKYSLEEKEELKRNIENLHILCNKMENDKAQEDNFIKAKWNEHLELSIEFMNKVVDPLYNGNGLEAIHNLMRNAIEEQNKKSQ